MKKLLFIFCALLLPMMAICEINSEQLVGIWQSKPIKVSLPPEAEGMKQFVTSRYEFSADGTVKSLQNLDISMGGNGQFVDLAIEVTANGNYTVEGDSISINYIHDTYMVNASDDNIRTRGFDDSMQESQVRDMMKQVLQGIKQEITAALEDHEVLNDVAINEKKMTCTSEGMEITLTRKKK